MKRISYFLDYLAFSLCDISYPGPCPMDDRPRRAEDCKNGRDDLFTRDRSDRVVLQFISDLFESSISVLVGRFYSNVKGALPLGRVGN
jgi:hypothetical protein